MEAVHALAPGANVLYVAGASCNGIDLLDAEVSVVDDNRASIVSISYGDVESNETTGQVHLRHLPVQAGGPAGHRLLRRLR